MTRYCILGGAGFIGSHVVKRLLVEDSQTQVTVFDNFTSGQRWHLQEVLSSPRLKIMEGDLKKQEQLQKAVSGAEVVYHFASNPDIAKAMTQPDVDFWEGTLLTHNVLEALRVQKVPRLLYASGSGVYGDVSSAVSEDHGPMLPISTYGASKLAGEALICAYCHMFGLAAVALRFANVVGPCQTHGVAYDFIRKLQASPQELEILGDGRQCKSYLHVEDVVDALRLLEKRLSAGYEYYNVATQDALTVTEIADLVVAELGLPPVRYRYTGGARGWKGDVPVVRINSDKLRALGWKNHHTSRAALAASVKALVQEFRSKGASA